MTRQRKDLRAHDFLPVFILILVLLFPAASSGQWIERTIEINVGWNSVFFDVDPAVSDADSLFDDPAIEAVWRRADQPLRILPNCPNPANPGPDCYEPQDTRWRTWLPPRTLGSFANTLRVIRGGVYLIKAKQPTSLAIVGKPVTSKTKWQSGYNLTGFFVEEDPNAAPTFAAFLQPSLAHSNSRVFQLTDDNWTELQTASSLIELGEGYWTSASSANNYSGPIDIDDSTLRGIDFARTLPEHAVTFKNKSASARNVSVRYESSVTPPEASAHPDLAGDTPLAWLDYGSNSLASAYQWKPLTSNHWSLSPAGDAGANMQLRVAVQRAGLSEAMVNQDGRGESYQGLLKISDGQGYSRYVSVAAQQGTGSGLWVGHASVSKVNWITAPTAAGSDAMTLRPTASEFSFRIILHDDGTTVHALSEVTMMVAPLSEYVLVTPAADATFVGELEAGSSVDGEPFSRRLSTSAFAFADAGTGADIDQVLTGNILAGGSLASGDFLLPADHRLNPFRHRYHPDHDSAGESYAISRNFTLDIDSGAPAGTGPEWGTTIWTGKYSETIDGLYKTGASQQERLLRVEGRFEIRLVSGVTNLNCASTTSVPCN